MSKGGGPSIAVIGPGAIGGLVAAYLAQRGSSVTLVAPRAAVATIEREGLHVSGVRGDCVVHVPVVESLSSAPDFAILCMKTPDLAEALDRNLGPLQDAIVVTCQNGVRSDELVAQRLPREHIVSSVVMFVSTRTGPGRIVHNAEGAWILGDLQVGNDRVAGLAAAVLGQGFEVTVSSQVRAMKYLKVFLNANNCLAAILNTSLQEAFADLRVARIAVAIWREGYALLDRLGIPLASLPGFPIERLTGLLAMPPSNAATILSTTMRNLSERPIYGSILQSIHRGRPSEIDFINGEFTALGREHRLEAPLNTALTEMVHAAERGRFLTVDQLVSRTEAFVSLPAEGGASSPTNLDPARNT